MKPGVWLNYRELAALCILVTTTVIAASWDILRDVFADVRAARARKQLRAVPSKHRS